MLGKTNAIRLNTLDTKDENQFDSNHLTLKRCEIVSSSSTSLHLKGISTDGYHADYVIDGEMNKMKILTFSCRFQSTVNYGYIEVYAGKNQSEASLSYHFDEVTDLGKVNLCIPIMEDYMEIRFGCYNTYDSLSEASFADIYLMIGREPIQMLNNGALDYHFEWQNSSYTTDRIPPGYTSGGEIQVNYPERQIKYADPSIEMVHVVPDEGKLLEEVWINPVATQSKIVTPKTSSQTVNPEEGKLLSSVVVNPIRTQTKLVTPSRESQTITPDSGKFLSSVSVAAIPVSLVNCNCLSVNTLNSGGSYVVDSKSTTAKKGVYVGVVNGIGYIDGSNDNSSWTNIGTYQDGGSSSAYTGSVTQGFVQNQTYRYLRVRYSGHSNGGLNKLFYGMFIAN